MDAGLPDYGCFIASEKRLTNFDISLNDAETVSPLRSKGASRSSFLVAAAYRGPPDFPWCGMVINTESLDVKADNGRYEEVGMWSVRMPAKPTPDSLLLQRSPIL